MSVKNFCSSLFLIAVLLSVVYADWKSDANSRIEQYRKRNAQINVVNINGRPIADVNVQIKQTKHHFAFGTCISSTQMSNDSYKNFLRDHFEWTAYENESKWIWNEWSQDIEDYDAADNIYNWCNANGIKVRAPCLFWEYQGFVQNWVKALDYKPWPQDCNLLKQCDERIVNAVTHLKNKIKQWDVDNEILPSGADCQFYDRLEVSAADVNSRVWMFQRANQIDPNCKLFLNEYNGNSFGSWTSPSTDYVNLVNNLRSKGAPIHGIGIQGHLGQRPNFNPITYWNNVLKPLGTLGLSIWVTEFDANEINDIRRAGIMDDFYRICFSDPNVEGILMWGFWQGLTWQSDWWIVNSDWTLNQTGQKYEALMDEWTTKDANITDLNGKTGFRGFHGTYEITLSRPGEPNAEIYTIELQPGEMPVEFTLITNTLGKPNDCSEVQTFGYALISDLNGDCYVDYEDLLIMTDYWLTATPIEIPTPEHSPDIHMGTDNIVNLLDFADLAAQWLTCNKPQTPGCAENW
ncbi:MAG: endo-1,4-beta-xylanase [Sedimentisphaerales bacterium]